MIPHTPRSPFGVSTPHLVIDRERQSGKFLANPPRSCENENEPGKTRPGPAELLLHVRRKASTEPSCLFFGLCLCQDTHDGLRARGPDEHAARARNACVDLVDAGTERCRQLLRAYSHILLDLRVAR